jgi:hypothetical protein
LGTKYLQAKRARGMAQVVECLSSNHKALSLKPRTAKKKKKKKKEKRKKRLARNVFAYGL